MMEKVIRVIGLLHLGEAGKVGAVVVLYLRLVVIGHEVHVPTRF